MDVRCGVVGFVDEMSGQGTIKTIPKNQIVDNDLWRMAKAMRRMIARKHPNPVERQAILARIMAEVRGTA